MTVRDLLALARALEDLEEMADDPDLEPAQRAGYLQEIARLEKRIRDFRKADRQKYDRRGSE